METEVGARSAIQVTITAILIKILNPKLSIFFLAQQLATLQLDDLEIVD